MLVLLFVFVVIMGSSGMAALPSGLGAAPSATAGMPEGARAVMQPQGANPGGRVMLGNPAGAVPGGPMAVRADRVEQRAGGASPEDSSIFHESGDSSSIFHWNVDDAKAKAKSVAM